jgi:hypothetical protein
MMAAASCRQQNRHQGDIAGRHHGALHSQRNRAMHREAIIDLLVLDCFEKMADSGRGIWLLSILRVGFAGFANMTDAQLADEFARCGLKAREDTVAGHEDWQEVEGIDEWSLPLAGKDHHQAEGCEY